MGKEEAEAEHVSNFFFTEYPEEADANEMFEVFKEYGLVVEVVTPQVEINRVGSLVLHVSER